MKQNYLFPHRYKIIGWCMLLPFMVGAIYCLDGYSVISCKVFAILSDDGLFNFTRTELLDEISVIGLAISLIFISFSREKDEDEYIEKIRLHSLMQSLMISCGILIFGTLFLYDGYYMMFSWIYMFVLLFSFVIIFNIRLIKFRKSCHE